MDIIHLHVNDLGNYEEPNNDRANANKTRDGRVYVHVVRGFNDPPVVIVPGMTTITSNCEADYTKQRDLTNTIQNAYEWPS